ncbi:MAG: DUF4238 domain-containing protein [Terriglobales bacterium]
MQLRTNMEPNQPRRHHYLPRFYQIGFAEGGDGRLWVYDRGRQTPFHAHPNNICCEHEFYTIHSNGTPHREIETDVLSRIDCSAADAIRQLGCPQPLALDWKRRISFFMALQITRSPTFRRVVTEAHRLAMESYLHIGFADVDRVRAQIARYESKTGKTIGVTAEALVQAVTSGEIKAVATERPFFDHLFSHLNMLADSLEQRAWEVLGAPARSGFLTCDYPVVVVPPNGSHMTGPAAPGSVILLPLTRRFCVRAIGGDGLANRAADSREVRQINLNVAISSERFVMGAGRFQLLDVVERSRTGASDPLQRGAVRLPSSGQDCDLIEATLWPRRRYFPL